MPTYGHKTLTCILLLLATEAVAVKPDETGEDIYQQDVVATESVEEEVIAEKKIATENNDNGEVEFVEPDEAGDDIYQEEAIATESVEEGVIAEKKIVTESNNNGQVESVEPDEAGDDIYQEEAVTTESVEEEVIAEEEIMTENTGSGEAEPAAVAVEVSEDDDTIQGEGTVDPVCIEGELYSAEAFPEESIYDEPIPEESIYAVLDKPHKYVSENVERLVTSVDRFFANDALYRYTTDSYVQITGDTLFEENGETGYAVKFRGRVDLPGTKRRFKLIFSTDPNEKQDPIERSVDESPAAAVQESDVYGSIQRERELRGWKFRPSIGAKLNIPIEPFAKLRFTNIYPLQSWALRADQNFYWFRDSGYGSDSTIEFDRPVGKENLFRASSFARWTEETEYFQLSQIFAFYQTLSPNRKISYQIGAYGQTQPTWFMTSYLLVVRYRQNLHKEWLFFEIRPQVLYSKTNDWDDELSLLLRLDILFGKKYL